MVNRSFCGGTGVSTIGTLYVGDCLGGDGSSFDPITIELDPSGQIFCTVDGLAILETNTSLVDNGDGTITYTNEDGAEYTINISGSTSEPGGSGTPFTCSDLSGCSIGTLADVEFFGALSNGDILKWSSTFGKFIEGPNFGQVLASDVSGNSININATNNDFSIHPSGDISVDISGRAFVVGFEEATSTLVNEGSGVFRYTDEEGSETVIDVCTEVSGNCPQITTTLVNNGDGSYTYTNEVGDQTTFNIASGNDESGFTCTDLNSCSIENMADVQFQSGPTHGQALLYNAGSNSFINANVLNVINLDDGTTVEQVLASDNTIAFSGINDATVTVSDPNTITVDVDVCAALDNCSLSGLGDVSGEIPDTGDVLSWDGSNWTPVAPTVSSETTTTLINNGNGSFTYTNEIGTETTFDICAESSGNCSQASVVDNGDGTWTFSPAWGTDVVIDVCDAVNTHCPPAPETTTTLVNNGDGTFTYTNEDGTTTEIDICTTVASFCGGGGSGSVIVESTDCIALTGNGSTTPIRSNPILATARNINGGDNWSGHGEPASETFSNSLQCNDDGLFVPCPIIQIPTAGIRDATWELKVACGSNWDIATFPAYYEIYGHADEISVGDQVTEGLGFDLALDTETGQVLWRDTAGVTHFWRNLNATAGDIFTESIVNGANSFGISGILANPTDDDNYLIIFFNDATGEIRRPEYTLSSGQITFNWSGSAETWKIIAVHVKDFLA